MENPMWLSEFPIYPKYIIQTVKAILRLFESDSVQGNYDYVFVWGENGTKDDGAGITYGAEQTTENGTTSFDVEGKKNGNLKALLELYASLGGSYTPQFEPYIEKLWDGVDKSKKYALTKNVAFRELLRTVGREDPVMREAQDAFFEKYYLLPALRLCYDYSFEMPLSLAVVYDSCIHSGPGDFLAEGEPRQGAADWLWHADGKMEDEEYSEIAFIEYYLNYRLEWLSRKRPRTQYRMLAFQKIIQKGNWGLTLPLEIDRAHPWSSGSNIREVSKENIQDIQVIYPIFS